MSNLRDCRFLEGDEDGLFQQDSFTDDDDCFNSDELLSSMVYCDSTGNYHDEMNEYNEIDDVDFENNKFSTGMNDLNTSKFKLDDAKVRRDSIPRSPIRMAQSPIPIESLQDYEVDTTDVNQNDLNILFTEEPSNTGNFSMSLATSKNFGRHNPHMNSPPVAPIRSLSDHDRSTPFDTETDTSLRSPVLRDNSRSGRLRWHRSQEYQESQSIDQVYPSPSQRDILCGESPLRSNSSLGLSNRGTLLGKSPSRTVSNSSSGRSLNAHAASMFSMDSSEMSVPVRSASLNTLPMNIEPFPILDTNRETLEQLQQQLLQNQRKRQLLQQQQLRQQRQQQIKMKQKQLQQQQLIQKMQLQQQQLKHSLNLQPHEIQEQEMQQQQIDTMQQMQRQRELQLQQNGMLQQQQQQQQHQQQQQNNQILQQNQQNQMLQQQQHKQMLLQQQHLDQMQQQQLWEQQQNQIGQHLPIKMQQKLPTQLQVQPDLPSQLQVPMQHPSQALVQQQAQMQQHQTSVRNQIQDHQLPLQQQMQEQMQQQITTQQQNMMMQQQSSMQQQKLQQQVLLQQQLQQLNAQQQNPNQQLLPLQQQIQQQVPLQEQLKQQFSSQQNISQQQMLQNFSVQQQMQLQVPIQQSKQQQALMQQQLQQIQNLQGESFATQPKEGRNQATSHQQIHSRQQITGPALMQEQLHAQQQISGQQVQQQLSLQFSLQGMNSEEERLEHVQALLRQQALEQRQQLHINQQQRQQVNQYGLSQSLHPGFSASNDRNTLNSSIHRDHPPNPYPRDTLGSDSFCSHSSQDMGSNTCSGGGLDFSANSCTNQQTNSNNEIPGTFNSFNGTNVSIASDQHTAKSLPVDLDSQPVQKVKGTPTLNAAMEKLCDSMKRSAMSRSMIKQFSGRNMVTKQSSGKNMLSLQNAASQSQRSNRSITRHTSDRVMGSARNSIPGSEQSLVRELSSRGVVRRPSFTKHQLQPPVRVVNRHESQPNLGGSSRHGNNSICLQIDGRNVGTLK